MNDDVHATTKDAYAVVPSEFHLAESAKSAADHLLVAVKAVVDQRWWEAAEVAGGGRRPS